MLNFYLAEDAPNGVYELFVQFAAHQFVNARSAVKLHIPIAGRVYGRVSALERACLGVELAEAA